jgi:hypothetical protein
MQQATWLVQLWLQTEDILSPKKAIKSLVATIDIAKCYAHQYVTMLSNSTNRRYVFHKRTITFKIPNTYRPRKWQGIHAVFLHGMIHQSRVNKATIVDPTHT